MYSLDDELGSYSLIRALCSLMDGMKDEAIYSLMQFIVLLFGKELKYIRNKAQSSGDSRDKRTGRKAE